MPALIQMSMGIPTYIESGHYNSSVHCLDVHEIHQSIISSSVVTHTELLITFKCYMQQ